jgi:hypothetical protein
MDTHLAHRLDGSTRREQPFPHFVVPDAAPSAVFERLMRERPADEIVRRGLPVGDNRRFSLSAPDALGDPRVPQAWRDAVLAHVGQPFLDGVLRALAPDIRKTYPDLEDRIGRPIGQWRAGLRRRDTFDTAEVLLDAQVCINTPVLTTASSVRGPHVDKPNKLFAGLWYLRPPEDTDTLGGELLIYRWRAGRARFDGAELEPRDVEVMAKVPYAGNTFVLFLNSLDALHGVTPRQPTPRTRWFLNLVGEVRVPLFDLKARQRPLRGLRRAWLRLRDRLAGRHTDAGQRWD